MVLILAPALLIVAVAFFISFRSAASFRQGVILNVTLPKEAVADARVQELIGGYKKTNLLLFLLTSASGALLLLPIPPSLSIMGIFLWIGLAGLAGNVMLTNYSKKLAAIKQQEGWFVGETDVKDLDLLVFREKDKRPVSGLWFLPSLVVALALLLWGFLPGASFFPALYAIGGLAVCFLSWCFSTRERSQAYSGDRETDLALTKISVRTWTLCWVGLANLHGIIVLLALLFLRYSGLRALIHVLLLEGFLFLGAIAWASNTTRRDQDCILAAPGPSITVDQDRYWRGGFYNNPHDSRIMVEKRVGYGATINFGTRKGKIIGYGLFGGSAALLIFLIFTFIAIDTGQYVLKISEEQIAVRAPFYGFSFPASELKSVTTLENLPKGMRTNGAETPQYCLGNYTMQGYGKSKLYVYKGKPPYLLLELDNLYVFINAKTASETERYHAALRILLAE